MGVDTHGRERYKKAPWARSRCVQAHVRQRVSDNMSFRTLLYRYFFFGWLFKDVNRGNLLERSAAWRYNREQARWLPTYMRRWMWCGLFFYSLGAVVEW